MIKKIKFIFRFWIARIVNKLDRGFRNRFFLVIAVAWGIFSIFDIYQTNYIQGIEDKTFDLALRKRFNFPSADPNIVLINIDEYSLKKIGGWPWSRTIYATAIEYLENQGAQAILLDILFADQHELSPAGDDHLNEVLKASKKTFLPFVRLDKSIDEYSAIYVQQIPSAERLLPSADELATINVTLPIFYKATALLGTDNLFQDNEGILRRYQLWENYKGWKIPSITDLVARKLGLSSQEHETIILNWRGGPGTYSSVSFVDVFSDAEKNIVNEQYQNKIFIINYTAAGVVSSKPTPMAKEFPSAEILATALDNLKHQDPIHKTPKSVIALLSILLISLLTYVNMQRSQFININFLFTILNTIGIAIFYLGFNFTNYCLDLISPLAYVNILFVIFSLYKLWKGRYLANRLFYEVPLYPGQCYHFYLQIIQLDTLDSDQRFRLTRNIGNLVLSLKSAPSIVSEWFDRSSLLGKELKDIVFLYWVKTSDQDQTINEDSKKLISWIQNEISNPFYQPKTQEGGLKVSKIFSTPYYFGQHEKSSIFHQTFAKAILNVIEQPRLFATKEKPL